MKKIYYILLLSLIVFSCSSDDNETSFDISGQFTDNVIKCNSVITEPIGCIKFVSFIDDSTAYVLVGGDILDTRNYKIKENKVIIEKQVEYQQTISFQIINETTLKRIQDDAIFLKNE